MLDKVCGIEAGSRRPDLLRLLYPVETSSNLRGTTGSMTASELIRFGQSWHRHRTGCGEDKEEEDEDEGDDDDDDNNDGVGGLTVHISPATMTEEAPSTSSSFLYPLLQTLDHELPLSDENDNPANNPVQDKHRILPHDMIRKARQESIVPPGRSLPLESTTVMALWDLLMRQEGLGW